MTAPARPLLALAAVLLHAAGPALLAESCECGPTCCVADEPADALCGCGDACGGCCGEHACGPEAVDPPAGEDACGCVIGDPAPAPPAAPGETPAPEAVAAFTAPADEYSPAAISAGPGDLQTIAEHAADPPVRVRLCVWLT